VRKKKLERISKNKAINIALVIDHSSSMMIGFPNLKDLYNIIFNDAPYVSPLEHAKNSALAFSESFNYKKDKISIVSFGSAVEINSKLTDDVNIVNQAINNINIGGSTAYFDALIAATNEIKKEKGINVVVSLTDGAENSSTHTIVDVIKKSQQHNVPIYSIGLGSVDEDTLKQITEETKGIFYHTDSPTELNGIYSKIGNQIQSYYSLIYKSHYGSKVKNKNVQIDFKKSSYFLKNIPNDPDVIAYLEKKEFYKKLNKYGSIAIKVLIGVGVISLVYYRKKHRRKKKNNAKKKI